MTSIDTLTGARELLALTNQRIVAVRRALRHRHDDEVWWSAHGMTAREAQRERERLRFAAHLLHVERAMARGRLHGFATLAEQRAWLGRYETYGIAGADERSTTLVALRARPTAALVVRGS